MKTIKDMPKHSRPREKLREKGACALTDEELVAAVLEVKGQPGDSDAKHQAARRWTAAVNHWGRLGAWDFLPCHDPQLLGQRLSNLATLWEQRAGRERVG